MAWLILFLLILIALGKFADFLLGKKGQRLVKDRLAAWYVEIAEGTWPNIVQVGAGSAHSFLNKVLGSDVISIRSVILSSIVSIFVTSLILFLVFTMQYSSALESIKLLVYSKFASVTLTIILVNLAIDIPSLHVTRALLYRVKLADRDRSIVGWFSLDLAAGYIAVSLAVWFTVPIAIFGMTQGESLGDIGFWWGMFWGKASEAFLHPWNANMSVGDTNFSIFALSAAFPTFIHVIAIISTYLARLTRPLTQNPVSLILQRLEESPNGVFTALSTALAVVIGIITAYMKT